MELLMVAKLLANEKFSRGFTILEITIVVILAGLFIATAGRAFDRYAAIKRYEDTHAAIDSANRALEQFFLSKGRYPCPASFSAPIGDPDYGRESDCTSAAVTLGCDSDYCVAERVIDSNTYRVRIGSLPFVTLTQENQDDASGGPIHIVEGKHAVDGYGNRLLYAVTEKQAGDDDTYVAGRGAIEIRTEHGDTIFDRADYIVISHGENAKGARSRQGIEVAACSGSSPETENCNNTAVFVDGLQRHSSAADYFDDTVSYRAWVPYYLWDVERGPLGTEEDIYNKGLGYVGVRVKDPAQRMHIKDGDFYSLNFWALSAWSMFGDSYDSSNIMQSIRNQGRVRIGGELCHPDPANPTQPGKCFPPELIGGDSFPSCGAGYIMTGIENNEPLCVPALADDGSASCDSAAGFYVKGFQYRVAPRAVRMICYNPITDIRYNVDL